MLDAFIINEIERKKRIEDEQKQDNRLWLPILEPSKDEDKDRAIKNPDTCDLA